MSSPMCRSKRGRVAAWLFGEAHHMALLNLSGATWRPLPGGTGGTEPAACGLGCLAIDVAFGKGSQFAVRSLFLLQILLQQVGAIRAPKLLGPGNQGAIARDL